MGTGVQVTEITRARDTFLDGQVRTQLASQGNWDTQKTTLSNIESVINEPSTSGLSSMMTNYFSAWQDVANNPSDASARADVVEQGKALANGFNNTVNQLQQQQRDLDSQIGDSVANINDYASQIADINKQIAQVETTGMHANDLRDQRDELLDKLSSVVKVSSVESSDGEVSVFVGGRQLVDRTTANQVDTVTPVGQAFSQVQWTDGAPFEPTNGQLLGLITSRDQVVATRIQGINDLATRVINQVNAVHESGTDLNGKPGVPFFTGTDATTMAVNSQLTGTSGTDFVAASRAYQTSAGPPPTFASASGDSSNAIALGELANTVAQVDTSTGLGSNPTVGAMNVTAISANGANANSTYSYSWDATNNTLQVTSAPNGTTSDVTATIQPAASGSNQVMTIDGLGVRLTVGVPNGTSLQNALQGMAGQSVSTAANPSTMGNQYSQFVAALGVDSNTAQGQSTNQAVLVNQLQQQQQSVSGVSLDEETTNLIQYQRAYQAAAHVVSVMDSMLDTLINHTAAGT
jgi:flagellar hook-associated protein 1 FlgK